MPDPTKKTVSATQVSALFNASPYETRWTLYQRFVGKLPWTTDEENDRMYWGKKLQPAILSAVADKLRLDVIPNTGDAYNRHPDLPLGCTPDGYVMDPQRGLGWIETKNVDGMIFRDQWAPTSPPKHIVLQHQAQLMIPLVEEDHQFFAEWGIVAALVGGNELHLYEFEPNGKLHERIAAEAAAFMEQVRGHNEPPVTGDPLELPEIATVWPRVIDEPLDLRGEPNDYEVATMIAEYIYATGSASGMRKWADQLKARLLGLAQDKNRIRTTGYQFKISKTPTDASVVGLPDDVLKSVGRLLNALEAETGPQAASIHDEIRAALTGWSQEIRRASITTRVTPKRFEDEAAAAPAAGPDAEIVA